MSARMAWQAGHFPGRPWCETVRHARRRRPAQWSVAMVNLPPDNETLTMSTCHECMNRFANDLGTTPEDGAVRPVQ